jgi:carbonic anhydrase
LIDETDFGEISNRDFDASLKNDVELIKNNPYFSKDLIVKGFLYDLKTGAIHEKV